MLSTVDFFRALADETRLRALSLLDAEGELCVCDLMQALDAPQPRISRHLALLRNLGVLSDRRQGQWVYYSISPDLPDWARGVLQAAMVPQLAGDRKRLEAFRKDAKRCD